MKEEMKYSVDQPNLSPRPVMLNLVLNITAMNWEMLFNPRSVSDW